MRILPIIVLLLTATLAFGQSTSDSTAISKAYEDYADAVNSGNIAEQVAWIYPKLFDQFPKDSLLSGLTMMQQDPNVQQETGALKALSEIYEWDQKKYALLSYRQAVTMDLSHMKGEGGASFAINLMLANLADDHGKENVIFNDSTYMLDLKTIQEMYAVFDPEYGSWKFLMKSEDMPVDESTIPTLIQEKF